MGIIRRWLTGELDEVNRESLLINLYNKRRKVDVKLKGAPRGENLAVSTVRGLEETVLVDILEAYTALKPFGISSQDSIDRIERYRSQYFGSGPFRKTFDIREYIRYRFSVECPSLIQPIALYDSFIDFGIDRCNSFFAKSPPTPLINQVDANLEIVTIDSLTKPIGERKGEIGFLNPEDLKDLDPPNETHQSTTDPESRLMRKAKGKEAKLSYGAHALMENRNGLLVDLQVTPATGTAETEAAEAMLKRQARKRIQPKTLGGDKGYDKRGFVTMLRSRKVTPHVAQNMERKGGSAIDGRTTRHIGYSLSQRFRKKVEEIFGWVKVVGGFRKTRFKGVQRTQLSAWFVGAAYNLLRIAKLMPSVARA